ncbi:MAG: TonB-dependent receptor, partial [Cyanobacteria bacterium P01_H01_bin.15]
LFDNIISSGATISEEELKRAGTLDVRANLGEPEISNSELDISRVSYRLSHEFSDTWQIKNEFLASFQNTYEDNSVVGVGFAQIDGQPNLNLLDRVYLENPNFRKVYTLNTNVIGNFPIAGIPQTLLAGVEWFVETEEDQITQRLFLPFLSPDSDPFNIFIQNYDPSRFFPGNNDNVRPGTDSFRRTSNVGFYGQTQLELTEQILVTLGGRLDFADQFFEDKANRADTSPINTNDTAFSPRVGLVFKPTSNISIYANYTTSFNPVIGRSEEGELFTPETGTQWEGGIKGRFFDERITATLAAFRLRRNNVLTQDPTNPGFQVQVGEQGSDGIEFDIAGELIPGLNLIASYAYIDARILEDNEFPPGRGLLNVPKNAASFWSTYEIQGGSLEGLGFGFGLLFVGDRNGDLRTPFVIPGYTRADAALYYRRGDFRAQLNIQNLFNARYFEGARDQFRVNPGAPFTIFGTLAVELN